MGDFGIDGQMKQRGAYVEGPGPWAAWADLGPMHSFTATQEKGKKGKKPMGSHGGHGRPLFPEDFLTALRKIRVEQAARR